MRPFLNSRFPHEIFGETLTSQVIQHCFFTKKHGFDFGRNCPKCAAESNGEEMGSGGAGGGAGSSGFLTPSQRQQDSNSALTKMPAGHMPLTHLGAPAHSR